MANILDLMRYASRGAVAKSDIDTTGEPDADFDAGARSIRDQLSQRPTPYHDPEHDVLVDVPGVDKLISDKRKGPKALKKMADNSDYMSADDPIPQYGTDAYYNMIEDLIRSQRGNKEKL